MQAPDKEVAYWILERERIRLQHDEGRPRPWTKDPILGTYRFCNVRREDDRVTRWLMKHYYAGHGNSVELTAAAVLARMINWPPTLERIGFPDPWDGDEIITTVHDQHDHGKAWGSAYVVTTCGRPMDKAVYVVENVCGAVRRAAIAPRKGDTLAAFWTRLRAIDGLWAGFIAAQVVADLKHLRTSPLRHASDWESWAVPGPGSRRGINRFYDLPLNHKLPDHEWWQRLDSARRQVLVHLPKNFENLDNQNMQNVFCEFDKYLRAKEGSGTPKQHYSPETRF